MYIAHINILSSLEAVVAGVGLKAVASGFLGCAGFSSTKRPATCAKMAKRIKISTYVTPSRSSRAGLGLCFADSVPFGIASRPLFSHGACIRLAVQELY